MLTTAAANGRPLVASTTWPTRRPVDESAGWLEKAAVSAKSRSRGARRTV
jgi:hypothetical protein